MTLSNTAPTNHGAHSQWLAAWRVKLGEQQNHRCCWCGVRMCDEPHQPNSATIEHVTPRSKGGAECPSNFAVACFRCNNYRGVMPAEEFAERVHEFYERTRQRLELREKMLAVGMIPQHLRHVRKPIKRRPAKHRRILDQILARKAIEEGGECAFAEGSRAWIFYQRYVRAGLKSAA